MKFKFIIIIVRIVKLQFRANNKIELSHEFMHLNEGLLLLRSENKKRLLSFYLI